MVIDARAMQAAKVRSWMDDIGLFSTDCLKILTKEGKLVPFQMNRAQLHIHEMLEEQRARLGLVRALILKGRQMGISTYVGARFFRQTLLWPGQQAAVIAHIMKSTQNLAAMVMRFYRYLPPHLQRPLSTKNKTEMVFEDLECQYGVFTAKTGEAGRGFTFNKLHGSEVAMWANAMDIVTGLRNALGDVPGTEEILESTGKGMNNMFYKAWSQAEAGFKAQGKEGGAGEYVHQTIFLPWWWDPGYRMKPWKGLDLYNTDIGVEQTAGSYANEYGLEEEQMAWFVHYLKNKLLDNKYLMRQEYPANAVEAFQGSSTGSLIRPNAILAARHCKVAEVDIGNRQLILGVDPARPDKELDEDGSVRPDRFAIIRRRGPKAYGLESRHDLNVPRAVEYLYRICMEERVDKVSIDVGGTGYGIIDGLKTMDGMRGRVVGVNFSHGTLEPERFCQKRDEMWGYMADWFHGGGVDVPDSDELHADLTGQTFDYENNKLKLDSKKKLRSDGIRSPDTADALALTFAVPDRAMLGYDDLGRPVSGRANQWRPPKPKATSWMQGLSSFHKRPHGGRGYW